MLNAKSVVPGGTALWFLIVAASAAGQTADSSHGALAVTIGAQQRIRAESWSHFGFGTSAAMSDQFVMNRVLLSADLRVGSHVRLYIEGKSAVLTERSLPGGRRPSDADDVDLQNAYLELRIPGGLPLALRAGRQELLFGKQRLVSPLDWANTRRTFEGLRSTALRGKWSLDAFWTRPVRVLKSDFNRRDSSVAFFGAYLQKKSGAAPGFDFYWFGLARPIPPGSAGAVREHRQTLGGRIAGRAGKGTWDYDLEAALQLGSVGGANILAMMNGSDLGFTPAGLALKPRFHAGFDYASGDAAAGGAAGTFNQLYPLGHAFLGYIDVVGRQNIVAPNVGVAVQPRKALTLDATTSRFWRARLADHLYNASGALERGAGTATSRSVGTELDLTVAYRIPRLVMLLGYSRMWAGAFVRETGPAAPISFLYGSIQVTN